MEKQCIKCFKEMSEDGVCAFCAEDNAGYKVEANQLPPNTILQNKYKIGKVIGSGGFGITYIGYDLNLQIKVAIKEYYPVNCVSRVTGANTVSSTGGSAGAFFERGKHKFIEEARILARYSSESGIVSVRDFFMENNTSYIVMEYIEGITLKEFLDDGKKLSLRDTVNMLNPVFSSLERIHKDGLIHRDISPDNIMLQRGGIPKLLDFGAARDFGSENQSLSVMLKHGYAPEEQYRTRGDQGKHTDVYALCATIYKCITGRRPEQSIERMYQDELEPPSKLGAMITPGEEAVLLKGMAVLKRDRFLSIEELRNAFLNANEDIKEVKETDEDRTLAELTQIGMETEKTEMSETIASESQTTSEAVEVEGTVVEDSHTNVGAVQAKPSNVGANVTEYKNSAPVLNTPHPKPVQKKPDFVPKPAPQGGESSDNNTVNYFADSKWRNKNSLWIIAAFLPIANGFAFLYAGFKSKKIMFSLIGVAALVVNILLLNQVIYYEPYSPPYHINYLASMFLLLIGNYYYTLGIMAVAVASGVLSIVLRVRYLSDLSDEINKNTDIEYDSLKNTSWKVLNSWWVLVALIPSFGMLVLPVILYRMKKYKFFVLSLGFVFILQVLSLSVNYIIRHSVFGSVYEFDYGMLLLLIDACYILQIFFAFLLRKPYLQNFAKEYEATLSKNASIGKLSWRLMNSFWSLFSFISYFSGLSVVIPGIMAKKVKWIIGGVVLVAISIYIFTSLGEYIYYAGFLYYKQDFISILFGAYLPTDIYYSQLLPVLLRLVFSASFIWSMAIRWEFFSRRIDALGGYGSAVEREISKRM